MVRSLPGRIHCLLVDPHSLASKRVVFLLGILITHAGRPVHLGRSGLYIVERRGKINVDVGLNDANSVVLIFRPDFEDVDLELISENFDSDGVFFVETGEVPELVLENGFWVV